MRANELPPNGTRSVPKRLHPAQSCYFERVDADIELRDGMNEWRRETEMDQAPLGKVLTAQRDLSMKCIYRMNDAHVHPPCRSGGLERQATGGDDGGSVHMPPCRSPLLTSKSTSKSSFLEKMPGWIDLNGQSLITTSTHCNIDPRLSGNRKTCLVDRRSETLSGLERFCVEELASKARALPESQNVQSQLTSRKNIIYRFGLEKRPIVL